MLLIKLIWNIPKLSASSWSSVIVFIIIINIFHVIIEPKGWHGSVLHVGQKWDQTIDNTDIVSKKHRCYIGKFPCVLIIQKKSELLQKTYFRSIFLLFLLLHSVGRVDAVIHVFFNYEGIHVDTAVGHVLICFTILCLIFFVIDRVGNCIIPSAAYHISCKIAVKQLVKSQIRWCIAVSCGIVRCM